MPESKHESEPPVLRATRTDVPETILTADVEPPLKQADPVRRRSPILGGVLLGCAIALAIVALAFAVRP